MPFRFPFATPFFNYRYSRYMPNQPYLNSNHISTTNNDSNISSNNYTQNSNNSNNINQNNSSNNNYNNINYISNTKTIADRSSSQADESTSRFDSNKNSNSDPDSDYFFEILGLKLYFDDVLIICILFFLYNEGVKDDELFLCLVLLLLT